MKTMIKRFIKPLLKVIRPIRTITTKQLMIEQLAYRMVQHRFKYGKGKGSRYWKSQAKIAIDYLEEMGYESMR